MAYDDPNANFDLTVQRFGGAAARGTILAFNLDPAPVVTCRVGGALFRALHEHLQDGLAADELGFTHGALGPITNAGTRLVRAPGICGVEPRPAATYLALDAVTDTYWIEGVVIVDIAFAASDPTKPIPTFETWCTTLGGTYTDELVT